MSNIKQKRFVVTAGIIVAVVVIVAIGGGIYWIFSQQQQPVTPPPTVTEEPKIPEPPTDETADWKVYRNEEYRFEVRYPARWFHQVTGGGMMTPAGVMFSDKSLEFYNPAPGVYPEKYINVVLYRTSETIDEYFINDLAGKKANTEFQKEIQISGQRGITAKSTFSKFIYLSAYTKKGDFVYIFESPISNKEVYTEVEGMFNLIITNFKFINQ